jgi:P27 family predicted phage terminase small subunit
MRTGRPPKPAALRKLEGMAGHRPLNEVEELKPRGPLGDPPDFLSPQARAVWQRVADAMPVGVIASADLDLMVAYVQAVSLLEEACRELQKTGAVIMGANDLLVVSPWCRVQIRQSLLVLRLASELGLTPAARASMAARLSVASGSVVDVIMPGTRQPSKLQRYLDQKPDKLPEN